MATRTILSIDGGGIRGIIPARVLAHVEERTGLRVAELFDFVAGTSTGGILALGFVAPDAQRKPMYSAAQLVELYVENGAEIFSRTGWHALEALDNLNGPKYTPDGIERVMRRYFGDVTLDRALTSTLVTAYEIERRLPFFFKSYEPDSARFPMWQIARATSAAPSYFPPERVSLETDTYAFVDGGVYANNPAMCVLVDALKGGVALDDVVVVSIGTGNLDRRIPWDKARGWGLVSWVHPLIDILMDGAVDTVDYQLRELLGAAGGPRRYFRIQTDLPDASQELDDARPATLATLKSVADRVIDANESALDDLCARLKEAVATRARAK